MLNLHLVVSLSTDGEIRQEYLGPDRLAAQKAYAANSPGAVQMGYYPFLQVAQLRKIKFAPELPVGKKK